MTTVRTGLECTYCHTVVPLGHIHLCEGLRPQLSRSERMSEPTIQVTLPLELAKRHAERWKSTRELASYTQGQCDLDAIYDAIKAALPKPLTPERVVGEAIGTYGVYAAIVERAVHALRKAGYLRDTPEP